MNPNEVANEKNIAAAQRLIEQFGVNGAINLIHEVSALPQQCFDSGCKEFWQLNGDLLDVLAETWPDSFEEPELPTY